MNNINIDVIKSYFFPVDKKIIRNICVVAMTFFLCKVLIKVSCFLDRGIKSVRRVLNAADNFDYKDDTIAKHISKLASTNLANSYTFDRDCTTKLTPLDKVDEVVSKYIDLKDNDIAPTGSNINLILNKAMSILGIDSEKMLKAIFMGPLNITEHFNNYKDLLEEVESLNSISIAGEDFDIHFNALDKLKSNIKKLKTLVHTLSLSDNKDDCLNILDNIKSLHLENKDMLLEHLVGVIVSFIIRSKKDEIAKIIFNAVDVVIVSAYNNKIGLSSIKNEKLRKIMSDFKDGVEFDLIEEKRCIESLKTSKDLISDLDSLFIMDIIEPKFVFENMYLSASSVSKNKEFLNILAMSINELAKSQIIDPLAGTEIKDGPFTTLSHIVKRNIYARKELLKDLSVESAYNYFYASVELTAEEVTNKYLTTLSKDKDRKRSLLFKRRLRKCVEGELSNLNPIARSSNKFGVLATFLVKVFANKMTSIVFNINSDESSSKEVKNKKSQAPKPKEYIYSDKKTDLIILEVVKELIKRLRKEGLLFTIITTIVNTFFSSKLEKLVDINKIIDQVLSFVKKPAEIKQENSVKSENTLLDLKLLKKWSNRHCLNIGSIHLPGLSGHILFKLINPIIKNKEMVTVAAADFLISISESISFMFVKIE